MADRLQEVRDEISRAFGDLVVPDPEKLVDEYVSLSPELRDRGRRSAKTLRDDLAEKNWVQIDAAFLERRWSSFCYLSAEGYRYYLPALLTQAIDQFEGPGSLAHSAFFSLAPSAFHLYWNGKDEHFEKQISLFDEGQHRAVCSFLGLGLRPETQLEYLAMKALRWGWNRFPTAAGDEVKRHYERLHGFKREPYTKEAAIQALVEKITDAFRDTPYPGDDNICGSEMGDEPAEYGLEFRGLDWRKIHPELLALNYASLSFFTPEAFRYFVPAYMISDVVEDVESAADPDFSLTYGLCDPADGEPKDRIEERRAYSMKRFEVFSPKERDAIAAYLRFKGPPKHVQQALDRFWLK